MVFDPGPEQKAKINSALSRELAKHYGGITARYSTYVGFSPVSIVIGSLAGKWGLFEPDKRRISLNEELYYKGGWDATVGVLTHETAHQIQHQLYHHSSIVEPPHGKTFQRICQKLNLEKFYVSASLDIKDDGSLPPNPIGKKGLDQSEHPILSKVRKLLALATSPESHEAAAALAAAERLLTAYNLELPGEAGAASPYERWRFPIGRQIESKYGFISNILSVFFHVECVFTYEFDPLTGGYDKFLEIMGKPVNLGMAEHVFHFLLERSETLWQAYRPTAFRMGEKGLAARNSFIHSLFRGFEAKLRKEQELARESRDPAILSREAALIELGAKSLERFKGECHPRLTNHRSNLRVQSPNSAAAGRSAGEKLTIHAPVPGGKQGVQGRLEC
jgi:hypothetical protein